MAAWLCRSGAHDVIVCARRPLDSITVEGPDESFVTHPRVITSPMEARAVDWVLVATKTYDAETTATWFPRLTADGAPVAILQNGVEHHARFAPYLPAKKILPVLVYCPAER